MEDEALAAAEQRMVQLRRQLRAERRKYRETTIALAAAGDIEARQAQSRLDSARWLHRAAYHVWRIIHRTRIARGEARRSPLDPEPQIELTDDQENITAASASSVGSDSLDPLSQGMPSGLAFMTTLPSRLRI